MRKVISVVVAVALALSLTACARPMNICGVTYGSYGLLNENDSRNQDIQYDVVWGNVFWRSLAEACAHLHHDMNTFPRTSCHFLLTSQHSSNQRPVESSASKY